MRFCFYSGYRDLKGGYTTLILTLIKELYRQKQEVVLINFSDGLIADELKKENIDITILCLDTLKWKEISARILSTDIFIITMFREEYRHFIKINPRLVYFDINDFITRISDYKFGIKFPSLGKRLVKELVDRKSLVFMDDTGIFNLKHEFSLTVKDPVFLPIPVYVPTENVYLKRRSLSSEVLHLTYIGRSVDWKMMPLKKVLSDCAKISIHKKIHFTIVVDDLIAFEKYINVDDFSDYDNLNISLMENLLPSVINEFLLNNADIHFAMGTAALDAAKLGVPTILVDYAKSEFPAGYTYKWLFETKGFSLGRNLDKIHADEGVSMDHILSDLPGNKEKLRSISERSYKYVSENHSVDKIVTRFITICKEARFRLSNAKNLVPFYFKSHNYIKNIFSFLQKGDNKR